jgi:HSP90 family molecular chaperone
VIILENESTSKNSIRVGTKIIKELSTTFYPDLKMVFGELVANARDAMATVVKINIGDNKITIEDNGEGMNKSQLVKFFYIAHTEKEEGELKVYRDIKRRLIGKFGIGKLTLYRICNSFEIISWRDSEMTKAIFDFNEFENNDFIDEFELKVEPVDEYFESDSGTKITLLNLKEHINARDIKRYLQQTMPLSPDFKILISGVGLSNEIELNSEDLLSGTIYEIKDDKDTGVGLVTGRIAFLEHGIKESGIYIRVLGRIVNYDHPNDIIDFTDITHSMQFQRFVLADINADGLNDVLLTNRSGFIDTDEKYITFKKWLARTIQKYVNVEYDKYQVKVKQFEIETIPKATADFIQTSLTSSEKTERIVKSWKSKQPKQIKHKAEIKKSEKLEEEHDEASIILEGLKFNIAMRPAGESMPEAIFDKEKKEIIINSDHPMYVFARSQGKRLGALYHSVKASIVVVALEVAKNLREFKELYDTMLLEAPVKMREVKLRRNGKRG